MEDQGTSTYFCIGAEPSPKHNVTFINCIRLFPNIETSSSEQTICPNVLNFIFNHFKGKEMKDPSINLLSLIKSLHERKIVHLLMTPIAKLVADKVNCSKENLDILESFLIPKQNEADSKKVRRERINGITSTLIFIPDSNEVETLLAEISQREEARENLDNLDGDDACQDDLKTFKPALANSKDAIEIHENQTEQAKILLGMILHYYGTKIEQFSSVEFIVLSPRFVSLRQQTAERLFKLSTCDSMEDAQKHIVGHFANDPDWMQFKNNVKSQPDTLFLLVDDECHYAPTKDYAHDNLLNDAELLHLENYFVLQISATPFNCLSKYSRIAPGNVLKWDALKKDKTACQRTTYQSLDSYIESGLWKFPPNFLNVTGWEGLRKFSYTPYDFYNAMRSLTPFLGEGLEIKTVEDALAHSEEYKRVLKEIFYQENSVENEENNLRVVLITEQDRDLLPAGHDFWFMLGFLKETKKSGGYEDDSQEHKLKSGKMMILANSIPRLCDPKYNQNCRPSASQRIKSDESMVTLIEKGRNVKCALPKQSAVKQASNSPSILKPNNEQQRTGFRNGQLSMANILISIAYFGFIRVDRVEEDGPVLKKIDLTEDIHDQTRRMVDHLNKIKSFRPDELAESSSFEQQITFVMSDFEKEARDTFNLPPKTSQDDVWKKIVENKLLAESNSSSSNDRLSWFTESDRIVQTLLDVDAPSKENVKRKGYLVFARIYGIDYSRLIQKCVQHAMKEWGLYYIKKNTGEKLRPFFAVVSDNGDANMFQEFGVQNWLDVSLDVSGTTIRNPLGPATSSSNSASENQVLSYSRLENVPCLIFLCEKGRMGDTFPHSLRIIDLRCRSAGTFATFIQEIGRACRYSLPHPEPVCIAMDGLKEIPSELTTCIKEDWPILCYRGTPVELTNDFWKQSELVGQAETLLELQELWEKKQVGDTFFRMEHKLPTILISGDIQKEIDCASRLRNKLCSDGQTDVAVIDCFGMKLDSYIKNSKSVLDSSRVPHSEQNYRQYSVLSTHFDHNNKAHHPRRVLLYAQPQMGKTGVFLCLIKILKEKIEMNERRKMELLPEIQLPDLNDEEDCVIVSNIDDWILPHHSMISNRLGLHNYYHLPSNGQYHDCLTKQRFDRWQQTKPDVELFKKKTEIEEVIVSQIGKRTLKGIAIPPGKPTDEHIYQEMVNWDKKLGQKRITMGTQLEYLRSVESEKDLIIRKWNSNCQISQRNQVHSQTPRAMILGSPLHAGSLSQEYHITFHPEKSLSSGPIKCTISIPRSKRDFCDFLTGSMLFKNPSLPPIFIPSHNRSKSGYFDLTKAILKIQRPIIVVCREDQYDLYKTAMSEVHFILKMPKTIKFKYFVFEREKEYKDSEGGIGFARLFIQLVSHFYFHFNQIWMLDDNIVSCWERGQGKTKVQCSFDEVIISLERIFLDSESTKLRENKRIEDLKRYKKDNLLVGEDVVAKTVEEYCGHKRSYGVLGISRWDRYDRRQEELQPFSFSTNSVFSFYLLNLESLCEAKVYYPVKPFLEDVEFLHCADEAGLAVGKFNRFIHVKAPIRPLSEEMGVFSALIHYLEGRILPKFDMFLVSKTPYNVLSPKCNTKCTLALDTLEKFQIFEKRNRSSPAKTILVFKVDEIDERFKKWGESNLMSLWKPFILAHALDDAVDGFILIENLMINEPWQFTGKCRLKEVKELSGIRVRWFENLKSYPITPVKPMKRKYEDEHINPNKLKVVHLVE